MATKLTNLGLQFPDNSVQQTAASGGDVKENLVIKTVTPNVVTNDPVLLREDGYVEKIVGSTQSQDVGSNSTLTTANTFTDHYQLGGQHVSAYDPDQNKVIVFYRGGSGYWSYKIGTPNSGDTLPSFGSEVVFTTSSGDNGLSICYDTTANKLLIGYSRYTTTPTSAYRYHVTLATVNSNNTLTVNDTEIIDSSPSLISANSTVSSIVHDVSSGRNVVAVELYGGVWLFCATPSGNSLVLGSLVEVGSANVDNTTPRLVYSPYIEKTIVLWEIHVTSNYGTGKSAVLEISSNGTITTNSYSTFITPNGWSHSMYRVYNGGSRWAGFEVADDGKETIVAVFRYFYGYVMAAGVIGSTQVTWTEPTSANYGGVFVDYDKVGLITHNGNTTNQFTGSWMDAGIALDVIWDENIKKFSMMYDTSYAHNIGGTNYDGAIAVIFSASDGKVTVEKMFGALGKYSGYPPSNSVKLLYLPTSNYTLAMGVNTVVDEIPYCVMYRPSGQVTNAEEFVGVASESGSGGSTIGVILRGSTYTGGSGLTPGETYYIDFDASLTTTNTTFQKLIAVSSTDLLIL